MSDIPPQLLAAVDQEFADFNSRLDLLVKGTRILIGEHGPVGAWASSIDMLGRIGVEDQQAMLACALVRLSGLES
jgi:hypothetical protein